MKKYIKNLIIVSSIIIIVVLLKIASNTVLGGTVLTTGTALFPQQGGTGLRLQPAKGDLLVGSSTTSFTHITVSSNDQVLTADSTTASGVAWKASAGGGGSVSTSSPISVNNFPFWATAGGALSGTSTITQTGTNGNITIGNEFTNNGLRSTSSTLSNISSNFTAGSVLFT